MAKSFSAASVEKAVSGVTDTAELSDYANAKLLAMSSTEYDIMRLWDLLITQLVQESQ